MRGNVKCVSILNSDGEQNVLKHFSPGENGQYRVPLLTTTEDIQQACVWLINSYNEPVSSMGAPYKYAVLDTGILPEHPIFKKYIKGHVDFTGEGITDLNGHGTLVTWQLLASCYQIASIKPNVELYICKILTADGMGTEENIIKGLKWAEEQNVQCVNLSAGIDNHKWFGLLECNATCDVCKTALELSEKGIMVMAAAGNDSKTVCPAKVGLYYPESSITSIGAADNSNHQKQEWSGEGNLYGLGTVTASNDVILQ